MLKQIEIVFAKQKKNEYDSKRQILQSYNPFLGIIKLNCFPDIVLEWPWSADERIAYLPQERRQAWAEGAIAKILFESFLIKGMASLFWRPVGT